MCWPGERQILQTQQGAIVSQSSIRVTVETDDALRYRADVLVLKHAQALYGVDGAAYTKLATAGIKPELPGIGAHQAVSSNHALGADRVLFLGVEALSDFSYAGIREFGRRAMSVLASHEQSTRHVALTIHGPGYGLDEIESFESELAGIIEAIAQNDYPEDLETVSFVERDRNRARRLAAVLKRLLPTGRLSRTGRGPLSGLDQPAEKKLRSAGYGSASKPRVFVAMPFADEMSDIFHYGIQGAVNSAGLLAERADLAAFTGDVMEWVRTRITGATLVIADLTSANPNVYLEVGYAWGRGIPTVLVVKSSTELKFDVRGQRCIVYSSIKDLEHKLTNELTGLIAARK
jgi:hypothetical protein